MNVKNKKFVLSCGVALLTVSILGNTVASAENLSSNSFQIYAENDSVAGKSFQSIAGKIKTSNSNPGTGEPGTGEEDNSVEKIQRLVSQAYTGMIMTNKKEVYSWGGYANGFNGNGNSGNSLTPARIPFTSKPVKISENVGGYARYSINEDGKVYSWGMGTYGQNGNGEMLDSAVPVEVQGLPTGKIKEVYASTQFNGYALTDDGKVYAWGRGNAGANGNGSNEHNTTAELVKGLPADDPVIEVITRNNGFGAYVLTRSGKVYAWGSGASGANGNGSMTQNNLIAEIVQGLPEDDPVKTVMSRTRSISGIGAYVITRSGAVYAWGQNNASSLGDNSIGNKATAVKVQGLPAEGVVELSLRDDAGAFALGKDGNAYVWGSASNGGSGTGTSPAVHDKTAKKIPNIPEGKVKTIKASGGTGGFALTTDGEVYSWGIGAKGGTGLGNEETQLTPAKVPGLEGVKIVKIEARGGSSTGTSLPTAYNHGAVALSSAGDVYMWGNGANGANGNGSTENNLTPQKVKGITGKVSDFSFRGIFNPRVITTDNKVFVWGSGLNGANGNGSTANELEAKELVIEFPKD